MHELSIADNIVRIVRDELRTRGACRVRSVRLRIGEWRQVMPESLQFCYTVITRDTELAGSQLEIERVALPGNELEITNIELDSEPSLTNCPARQT